MKKPINIDNVTGNTSLSFNKAVIEQPYIPAVIVAIQNGTSISYIILFFFYHPIIIDYRDQPFHINKTIHNSSSTFNTSIIPKNIDGVFIMPLSSSAALT